MYEFLRVYVFFFIKSIFETIFKIDETMVNAKLSYSDANMYAYNVCSVGMVCVYFI